MKNQKHKKKVNPARWIDLKIKILEGDKEIETLASITGGRRPMEDDLASSIAILLNDLSSRTVYPPRVLCLAILEYFSVRDEEGENTGMTITNANEVGLIRVMTYLAHQA